MQQCTSYTAIAISLVIIGVVSGLPVNDQSKTSSLNYKLPDSQPELNIEPTTGNPITIESEDDEILENKPFYDSTEDLKESEEHLRLAHEKDSTKSDEETTTPAAYLYDENVETTIRTPSSDYYAVKNNAFVPTMQEYLNLNPHLINADNVAVQVNVMGDLGMNMNLPSIKTPFNKPSPPGTSDHTNITKSPYNSSKVKFATNLSKFKIMVTSTTARSPVAAVVDYVKIEDQVNILHEIPQNTSTTTTTTVVSGQNAEDNLQDYDGFVLSSRIKRA